MKHTVSSRIMFSSLVALICFLAVTMAICFAYDEDVIAWILLAALLLTVMSLVYYIFTSEDFRTEVVPTLFGTNKLKCEFCTARFLQEDEVKAHELTCVHRTNREGDAEGEQKVDVQYEAPVDNKPSYLQEQNKAFAEEQKWRREEDPSNNGSPRSNATSPRWNQDYDQEAYPAEAPEPVDV